MPTLTSFILFVIAAILGTISSISANESGGTILSGLTLLLMATFAFLWFLGTFTIPLIGIYQLIKKDRKTGLANISLGTASLAGIILFYFLSLAIT